MSSPHLEAERDRLLQLIQSIRNSGSVAPSNVWISPAPKGEHLYYKLSSKNPAYKTSTWARQAVRSIATGEPESSEGRRLLSWSSNFLCCKL